MTTNTTITLSVTPDDLTTIEQVVSMVPLSSRHGVARAAMRDGLDRMANNPKLALKQLVAHGPRTTKGGAA